MRNIVSHTTGSTKVILLWVLELFVLFVHTKFVHIAIVAIPRTELSISCHSAVLNIAVVLRGMIVRFSIMLGSTVAWVDYYHNLIKKKKKKKKKTIYFANKPKEKYTKTALK